MYALGAFHLPPPPSASPGHDLPNPRAFARLWPQCRKQAGESESTDIQEGHTASAPCHWGDTKCLKDGIPPPVSPYTQTRTHCTHYACQGHLHPEPILSWPEMTTQS